MRGLFERKKEVLRAIGGATVPSLDLLRHILADLKDLELMSRTADAALNRELIEFVSGLGSFTAGMASLPAAAGAGSVVGAGASAADRASATVTTTPAVATEATSHLGWILAAKSEGADLVLRYFKLLREWRASSVISMEDYLAILEQSQTACSFIKKLIQVSSRNMSVLIKEEQFELFDYYYDKEKLFSLEIILRSELSELVVRSSEEAGRLIGRYREYLVGKVGAEEADKRISNFLTSWLSDFLKKAPSATTKINLMALLSEYFKGEQPPVVQAVFFEPNSYRRDDPESKRKLLLALRHKILSTSETGGYSYNYFKTYCAEELFKFILNEIPKADYLDCLEEILDAETPLGVFFGDWLDCYLFPRRGLGKGEGLVVSELLSTLLSAVSVCAESSETLKKIVSILAKEVTGFRSFGLSFSLHIYIGKYASAEQLLSYLNLLMNVCAAGPAELNFFVSMLLCSSYIKAKRTSAAGSEETLKTTYLSGLIFENVTGDLRSLALVEQYIRLLEMIFQKMPKGLIARSLELFYETHGTIVPGTGQDFFGLAKGYFAERPDLLLRLIRNNLIGEKNIVKISALSSKVAEELVKQSRALSLIEAALLLREALNPATLVGAYFAVEATAPTRSVMSSLLFPVAPTVSAKTIIQAELDRLTAAAGAAPAPRGGIN